jgi:hypothetical protein
VDYFIAWILPTIVGLLISWGIIYSAVRAALAAHYKTVRWYEKTGEWITRTSTTRTPPRPFNE